VQFAQEGAAVEGGRQAVAIGLGFGDGEARIERVALSRESRQDGLGGGRNITRVQPQPLQERARFARGFA
jgi:hypothetical protein